MIKPLQKRILMLAVKAGEIMMKSGAEIYRVEDTITRICNACRIPHVEVFATPTGLFVSIDSGDDESEVLTYVNRIHSSATDLMKIAEINQFSRIFTNTSLSIGEGLKLLDKIASHKPYPFWIRLIGAFLVSSFFCRLLSGSLIDTICSGVIGVTSYGLSSFLYKYDINYFIRGFCCCALATVLSLLSVTLAIGNSAGSMIIGSMMLFVPGTAITNSIRDLLSGDMLSGLARMAEAFVVAVSLATGAGIVIKLWSFMGISTETVSQSNEMVISLIMGFFATLGFCILLHVPKKSIVVSSLVGGIAWAIFQLTMGFGSIAACFLAACAVGILSEILSRLLKQASTVFSIPGIMPLVPGSGMYYTMLKLINGNLDSAASLGAQTMFLAGAIALGLLVTSSIIRMTLTIHRKVLRK